MKKQNLTFLLILFMSMMDIDAIAHDIAVANSDGVTIYYRWANNNTELSVSFPGNTSSSYSNAYIGSVVIPETVTYNGTTYSVTSIGEYAFRGCTGLTSVTIPNSVTSIGKYAFWYCPNLTSVTIPNLVTSIGNCAFINCYGLTEVNYNATNCTTMGSSDDSVFKNCSSLTTLTIGENVQMIPSFAFSSCSGLTSVTIPKSVTSIGNCAFYNCSSLTSITIPNSVTSIGVNAFQYCSSLKSITIPNSVTSINGTFWGCSSLTSVTIPSSVTNIGESAFSECSGLTSITIPNSVTSIGNCAFSGCSSLTSITIPNSVTSIGHDAFRECSSLTGMTIPNSVTSISSGEFYGCSVLTSVTIPNSVTSIGEGAFHSCYGLKSITIPNSVKSIGRIAFGYCSSLTSVNIPNSVTSIDKYAFNGCTNLTFVSFEDGTSTLDLGDGHTFDECPLNTLYFGRNISYKKDTPFINNNNSIVKISIGKYVTEINKSLFSDFKRLTSIELPNSLKIIGAQAFYGCEGLTEITIPGSVEEIYEQAFDLCRNIKKITFSDGTERLVFTSSSPNILNNAFTNSPIEEIYMGRNFSFSNSSPLSLFETLTSLTLGELVTNISERSFIGCPNLKDVTSYSKVVPTANGYVFTPSYLSDAVLHVPHALYDGYKVANVWKDFGKIVNFEGLYDLIYLVDGVEYKKYTIEQGTAITAESEPEKEGYTFSGWSEIPQMMPDYDVMVSGTFTVNKYKLTYVVDGQTYKTYEVDFGTTITPEPIPTKEGYSFSGWNNLPATMPAHDVTVTGLFIVNIYKLIYVVDGEEYANYGIPFGASITPEPIPMKEGCTFSGWNAVPETMPAHDVIVTGSFIPNKYKLTYYVDDVEYKSYDVEFKTIITPEPSPFKNGYTFSGWIGLPETMPAHDVNVTGTFSINTYKLTYMIDGEEFASFELQYGTEITPLESPTKEGCTFSGWSAIPVTMPARDVTVTGTMIPNNYQLVYLVDGLEYKTVDVPFGSTITPEQEPEKEGYTFSGWIGLPETMPAHDVTVTGTFSINSYMLTYMIGDKVYKLVTYEYGAAITPEPKPEGDYVSFEWVGVPETMPAHDVTVTAVYETGIAEIVMMAQQGQVHIYSPNGKKQNKLQKGLNIVVMQDGMTKKVVVK